MKKRVFNFWFINVLLCLSVIIVCSEKEQETLRNALNEKIVQQRRMIKERQKQQWLWNTAKIVGPLGLMALTAYQLLKPSPIVIEQLTTQDKIIVDETPIQLQQPEQGLFSPIEHLNQPLKKEDVLKYKQASKAYGAAAVWFSLTALFDPFFYPYAAANFMGSLYYGIKSLQLPLKPVVLKDISIIPDDLPY